MNIGSYLNKMYVNASDSDKRLIESYLDSKAKEDVSYKVLNNALNIANEDNN